MLLFFNVVPSIPIVQDITPIYMDVGGMQNLAGFTSNISQEVSDYPLVDLMSSLCVLCMDVKGKLLTCMHACMHCKKKWCVRHTKFGVLRLSKMAHPEWYAIHTTCIVWDSHQLWCDIHTSFG